MHPGTSCLFTKTSTMLTLRSNGSVSSCLRRPEAAVCPPAPNGTPSAVGTSQAFPSLDGSVVDNEDERVLTYCFQSGRSHCWLPPVSMNLIARQYLNAHGFPLRTTMSGWEVHHWLQSFCVAPTSCNSRGGPHTLDKGADLCTGSAVLCR